MVCLRARYSGHLFTLYIDDMVQQVEHCDIQLYADDTILYYSDNDVNCIDDFLNADLKRIHGGCV